MEDNNNINYGLLIHRNDILIQRKQFKEATRLIGMPNVTYYEPMKDKNFDPHGDLKSNYKDPIPVGCFFHEHPDQKTMKKVGWVAELQEGSSLIEVAYDVPGIQVGALFNVPAGLDNAEPRMFRVISMKNIMLDPVSITCEIAPEYKSVEPLNTLHDYSATSFTHVVDLEGDD